MESSKEAHLREQARHGALIRGWLSHEGGKLMRKKVDELTGKLHTRWMLASEEEAKLIREEAKGYELLFSLAKKVILEGDNATRQLEAEAKASL